MRIAKGLLITGLLLGSTLAMAAQPKASASNNVDTNLITTYKQTKLTPAQVLDRLKQGNKRYQSGQSEKYDQRQLSKQAAQKGQAPLAFVFSCVDSRSVPDVIFDQPVGSMFVSRIAGNVVSTDVLGSMEFATKYAGTKLVVIMGHTKCGAVAGACAGVDTPDKLKKMLGKIKPAVDRVASQVKKKNCGDMKQIDAMAKRNVINQMKTLLANSPALADMQKTGKIKLVGAMHDIKTGQVTFFNIQGDDV